MKLIHGDCLEEMAKIPDKSIDLILTDPLMSLKIMEEVKMNLRIVIW